MNAVWKYALAIDDAQTIEIPEGAELLTVGNQNGELVLWARVNPSGDPVRREILIRGTGHPIGGWPYVGSAQFADGLLVWHVFDGGVFA